MSLRSSLTFHNSVIDAAESLRPLPSTVVELTAAAANEECTIDDLVQIIQRDPVLVSVMLREANSASSASATGISTVDTALMRIGTARTVAIAVGSCVGDLTESALTGYGLESEAFWNHSRATMVVAEMLVASSRGRLPASTVTAAIIHDIGKVVLSQYLHPGHFELALDETGNEALADRMLVDLDHAEVGALLAAYWRLPAEIVEAIRGSHCIDGGESPMARAVHVADTLAHSLLGRRASELTGEISVAMQTLDELEVPKAKLVDRCIDKLEKEFGTVLENTLTDFC
jgi:HD-like signal output (HDOD) protein